MIPTTFNLAEADSITNLIQPTLTYKLHIDKGRVQGTTDGVEAIKQMIYKLFQTERYDYPQIYSSNYGVEFKELIGQPIEWVIPQATIRIQEALMWDDRILSVYNFKYDVKKKTVHITFNVDTIFGTIESEVQIRNG